MSGFERVESCFWSGSFNAKVVYLVLALPLLYAGFVQSFWGNDPYLGWAITVIASVIIAKPLFLICPAIPSLNAPTQCRHDLLVRLDYVDITGCG
jgi:hypothetical protein